MPPLNRRALMRGMSAAVAAAALTPSARPHLRRTDEPAPTPQDPAPQDPAGAPTAEESAPAAAPREPLPLRFAVKFGMVGGDGTILEKFQLLKRIGFDGVELDAPSALDRDEVLRARDESGLPIHGVVDSIHWKTRLSDPDPARRAEAIAGLRAAIDDAKACGASSVLLVPGVAADAAHENHEQVWERSIEGIREVLPQAAALGIHVLIENVWNRFCYDHDGADDQTADRLRDYLDAIASPWVGSYFDIGNHRKYGRPQDWIHTLGRRVVKLDVKDWGRQAGWSKIGDGDVEWPEVRHALRDIGYAGWATAEVGGGGEERLREILGRMEGALGPRGPLGS